jgi:peptidoglycan/xylan/chitin deacetylase (PgdA/CDA1 family)
MNMPGLARISGKLRRLWPRSRPIALILLYHRVAAPATDPQLLSVTPERFAGHMAYLSRHFEVISLRELVERKAKAGNRSRVIAVTFDDGYADNLSRAKPILESSRVPATVFVSTAALEAGSAFWWDDLEHLLLHPSSLPPSLTLQIDGQRLEFELGDDAEYTHEKFKAHEKWNVLHGEDPTLRHRLYRVLCRLLKPTMEETRKRTLSTLRIWAGRSQDRCCEARMLTGEDVRHLAEGPWVEVGAHTVSHPVLGNLTLDVQRREIGSSKECLEAMVGRPVETFAYPYGTKADYTNATAALVKEEGFALACSNYPEAVTRTSDIYQLPRFVVRDWTEERFAETLAAWWEGREGDEHCDQ